MRSLPRTFAVLTMAMAFAGTAMAQAPAPVATPGESIPLARHIPKDGVFAYIEIQGTEANSAVWSQTAASKILNDTTTGAMLDAMMVQLLDRMFASMPNAAMPDYVKPTGEEYMGLIRHGLRHGMVFALSRKPNDPNGAFVTAVFKKAMLDDTSKRTFAALIRGITPTNGKTAKVAKPGNRSIAAISKADGTVEGTFWVENKMDLVLTDNPDAVIAAMDGKSPSVADLPTRTEMFTEADGFAPLAAAWFDVDAMPPIPPQTVQTFSRIGLKGVKRVDLRFGTRGEALMHEVRVVAPKPRTGVLAMVDQTNFTMKSMPALPSGTEEFTTFSLDLPTLYDQVQTLATQINPAAKSAFETAEATVKARTRLRLKEDLLARLGPKMTVYAAPKAKTSGGIFGALGGGGVQVPKGAVLIEIADPKATTTMIDQLMIFANKEIKTQMAALAPPPAGGEGGRRSSAAPPMPEFKVLINNPKTYVLNLPTQYAAATNLRLTVAVGKKSLVIASMPDAAKEAIDAEETADDNAVAETVAKAVEGLPTEFTLLSVSDPSDTLPEGLARLPLSVNMMFPPPPGGGPPGVGGQGPPPGLGEPGSPGEPERGPRGGRRPQAEPGGGGQRPQAAPGGGGQRPQAAPGGGGQRPQANPGGGGDGPIPPSLVVGAAVGQVPPGQGAGPGPIAIDPSWPLPPMRSAPCSFPVPRQWW